MCSKVAPMVQGEKWAEEHYTKECDDLIIYGIGVGYHIFALQEKIETRQKIIVIEANQLLYNWALKQDIITKFREKGIEYKLIRDKQDFLEVFEKSKGKNRVIELLGYKPSLEVFPHELNQLKEILDIFFMKKYYGDRLGEEAALISMYHESKHYDNISKWYNTVTDKPILIVSAGPSLSDTLEEIKKFQDKMFIFATGRVLRALVEAGIRVDMFCIIDPHEITYSQIEGVEHLQIPFVFLDTVCARTVDSYLGPKYIAYNMGCPESQEGRIESGGSVATAVMDLAIRFGTKNIIFVGQDLAFSDQKTHALECRGEEVIHTEHLRKVKAIDDSYIPTTLGLMSFKRWIEYKISRTSHVRFINATKAGAYIVGCEHMSLGNAIREIYWEK